MRLLTDRFISLLKRPAGRRESSALILPALLAGMLSGCGETALLPVSAGYGSSPQLPEPRETLIPTVSIRRVQGWQEGHIPQAAAGTQVNVFASDLQNPRWLYVLPNGDVLVAESNAPEGNIPGFRGWIAGIVMGISGSSEPSANRITLLRDSNGDGVADMRSVFLENLNSPFGMALIDERFYVANTDALLVFPYQEGQTQITVEPELLTDLTLGSLNYHWTKNLIASPDGDLLYVAIGSNSNIAEYGLEEEEGRAAIWEVDPQDGSYRIFASGLRNPVGMAWEPTSGRLWTAVNERDELGSDLVPDYMTSVRENGFYGWPWSYFGDYIDERVEPQRPDMVSQALLPEYALGNHTASLGLSWVDNSRLPQHLNHGMVVGQRGSWNRRPHSGYKVIFVPFQEGRPAGEHIDILTGFRDDNGTYGRPVGVTLDGRGDLLVADDAGGTVWRVTGAP